VGVFLTLLASGCSATPSTETPIGALTLLLSAMDGSGDDPEALRTAFFLLDKEARQELTQRAHKAEAIAGRELMPWEMLVPGRFSLRFAPGSRGGMHAKVTGNRAVVTVTAENKQRTADVPLVREADGWRVELTALGLQKRVQDGSPSGSSSSGKSLFSSPNGASDATR
jgi:hypothetical protein